MAHERLFRLGIASYLVCMLSDATLLTALYVILNRVDQNLALFAACLRLVETVIGVAATLSSFDVLRLLSGADYLQAFRTDQLQALARIPISAFGAEINASFVFLGLGSTVFGYLWLKSNYIPTQGRVLLVIFVEHLQRFAPGCFLTGVNLPQIQHRPLCHLLGPTRRFSTTLN